jgi:hypothetical protein
MSAIKGPPLHKEAKGYFGDIPARDQGHAKQFHFRDDVEGVIFQQDANAGYSPKANTL